MDPIHHGMTKVPSSIKLMSIHKENWLGYIVITIHNVYSLPRMMLQFLHWEIYMISNNIGYKHIHGAIEHRMRLSFYFFSLENQAWFEIVGQGIESDILNKLQSWKGIGLYKFSYLKGIKDNHFYKLHSRYMSKNYNIYGQLNINNGISWCLKLKR